MRYLRANFILKLLQTLIVMIIMTQRLLNLLVPNILVNFVSINQCKLTFRPEVFYIYLFIFIFVYSSIYVHQHI